PELTPSSQRPKLVGEQKPTDAKKVAARVRLQLLNRRKHTFERAAVFFLVFSQNACRMWTDE
ncbi:hypothetical protein, partial [Salmonella sp. s58408]|uniref:hypothetical protein n=1 Tax=Salmonella sp. s58408 TaxID=3159701 RepID=UPI003980FEE6